MCKVKSLRLLVLWAVLTLLVSLVLQFVMPGSSAMAEDITLRYDDDVAVRFKIYGCPSCSNYQGVLFSLPDGVPSAVLTAVQYYYKSSKYPTKPTFFVSKPDQKTFLAYGLSQTVTKAGWQTFTFPTPVVVSDDFWFIITRHTTDANCAQDSKNDAKRSFMGSNVNEVDQKTDGDFLIRAIIRPEAHVGEGQPFATIQAAIDAVEPDVPIIVHDGVYTENVTVYKRLPIRSLGGAGTTVVTSADPSRDAFLVTADGVSISGFTIRGGTGTSSAGVRIEESSGCLVSGNVILGNTHGIYVSEGSTMNILLENECKFNTYGIYVDGSQNYVSGNKIHRNTAPTGSAVFLSSAAAGNMLRFNSITVDAGTEPGLASSAQVYNQNILEGASAIDNWWGSDSGPFNTGGEGCRLGENVLFDPWLTMAPLRVRTGFTSTGDYTFAATETMTLVLKHGVGTPVVSVANFQDNPAGKFPTTSIGKWIDVLFHSTDGVESAEIRLYYNQTDIDAARVKEGSLRLYWWDGQRWKVCSDSHVDKEGDFVSATVKSLGKPNLGNMGGTLFAAGTFSKGFAWWVIPIIIVAVLVLLIAFRLFWVLVVKGERS